MLYGTAGLAFAEVSLNSSVAVGEPVMGVLAGSKEDTKTGWTAGGGGALAITDHLAVKAEALYYDLGHISIQSTSSHRSSTRHPSYRSGHTRDHCARWNRLSVLSEYRSAVSC